MASSAFSSCIRKLPGNQNLRIEGESRRKEGGSISIFGSAIEAQKNYGRTFSLKNIGFRRLAECAPLIKTPSTRKA